jgi:hypothetical protein
MSSTGQVDARQGVAGACFDLAREAAGFCGSVL